MIRAFRMYGTTGDKWVYSPEVKPVRSFGARHVRAQGQILMVQLQTPTRSMKK